MRKITLLIISGVLLIILAGFVEDILHKFIMKGEYYDYLA